jgi:glycosyltransferase involved in cell wall biosynthesis
MRILVPIDYPWWNGSAYYGISMALALTGRGHDVRVLGREGAPPLQKAREWGLPVRSGFDPRGRGRWSPGAALVPLMRLLRAERPDVVIAHDGDSHTIAALAIALTGARARLMRGRGDIRAPSGHFLGGWLYGRRTEAFLLSGEFMIRRGDFHGRVRRDALHVIHPPIDTRAIAPGSDGGPLRREFGLEAGTPLVGLVARYDPVKGHDTFLRAAWRLRTLFPEAHFLAAGNEEGVRIDRLRKTARELELGDRVHFIGRRSSPAGILAALDVGVIASKGSEAVCRILVEYMAAAVPVVATAVGVIPEVIEDGVTGFLVPPDDHEAMARKIGAFLGDPDLRRRMGYAGRRRVESRFSLERTGESLDAVLSGGAGAGGAA